MKISTKNIANLVSDLDVSIGSFFTTQELDQLAREAGFVQRKSKLNGSLFLGDFRKIFSPYTENPETELWYKGINADTNIQTLLHPSEASLQRQSRRIRFFSTPRYSGSGFMYGYQCPDL